MRMVWRAIGGVEEGTVGGGLRLLEAACATALHYADLIHGALADQGYYENHGKIIILRNFNFIKSHVNDIHT